MYHKTAFALMLAAFVGALLLSLSVLLAGSEVSSAAETPATGTTAETSGAETSGQNAEPPITKDQSRLAVFEDGTQTPECHDRPIRRWDQFTGDYVTVGTTRVCW
ncbi:hypothetical protein JM93_00927 [Roseibium hamelinense]|uniref:Uncharacterized protein n=1 Tax=Roseibium hamelinense TaxID=150831 RepID=A0A562TI78_9HYPH|nr:hypothetical protein [Roseibium hamelinense]MTI42625.1 hypothetical protein [Roseibium hamelinense]TWI93371.1 hypothetical protein JM93_00927 [Roseibium hamelinense]